MLAILETIRDRCGSLIDTANYIATRVDQLLAISRKPAFPISNINFTSPEGNSMSETSGTGTNVGTFNTTAGFTCNFFAAVQNNDNTPPSVVLTPSSGGTVTIGNYDLVHNGYPVAISNLAAGTTIVEIAGDNVDDCYLEIIAGAPPVETFSVDPTTVTFAAPAQAQAQAAAAAPGPQTGTAPSASSK